MLLGLLLTGSTLLFSQSKEIDSMKAFLDKKSLSDSLRMETLLQLGWDMSFYNTDQARHYLNECIQIAAKNNNANMIGSGFAYIGSSFFTENKFDSALHYYLIAENHFLQDTSAEAQENVIVNRMSMGTVALQQNLYEEALGHYFKVIDFFENSSSENWGNLITAYANVGLVYNDMRQYDKALFYHKRALSKFEGNNADDKKRAQVQMLVAIDLLNLKQYEEFHTIMDSTENLVRHLNSNYLSASFYALKGRYLNDVKEYYSSVAVSKKALSHARAASSTFDEANILFQLGRSYFSLGDYKTSLQNFLAGLEISRALQDGARVRNTVHYIAQAYQKSGNYKSAAEYFDLYGKLSDSLQKDKEDIATFFPGSYIEFKSDGSLYIYGRRMDEAEFDEAYGTYTISNNTVTMSTCGNGLLFEIQKLEKKVLILSTSGKYIEDDDEYFDTITMYLSR